MSDLRDTIAAAIYATLPDKVTEDMRYSIRVNKVMYAIENAMPKRKRINPNEYKDINPVVIDKVSRQMGFNEAVVLMENAVGKLSASDDSPTVQANAEPKSKLANPGRKVGG